MSTIPPPPLDPSDPRAGDPTKITTWIIIGGVIITIIVIGSINQWNRGQAGSPPPAVPGSASSVPPSQNSTTNPAPTGVYKIIFDGSATGHYDRPNYGQSFRSSDATETWHLEYRYGDNSGSGAPDPGTVVVTGHGDSKFWTSNVHDCVAGPPTYHPKVSLLKRPGGSDTFSLNVPSSDIYDDTGCLAFTNAWYVTCGSGTNHCPDPSFATVTFTIKPGQTGTVVTPVAIRNVDYTNNGPPSPGDHTIISWSGTITVIAQ